MPAARRTAPALRRAAKHRTVRAREGLSGLAAATRGKASMPIVGKGCRESQEICAAKKTPPVAAGECDDWRLARPGARHATP
jgi:hypothetical protein